MGGLPYAGRAAGGPAAIRSLISRMRSGESCGISHRVSSHQVQPASAQGATCAAAVAGSSAGVSPSATMSRSGPAPCAVSQSRTARASSGPGSRPSVSNCGMMPSQRSTRRMDFGRGHTPTTQTGIRCWTGRPG